MIQRWCWALVRVSSQGLRLGRAARRPGQGECRYVFAGSGWQRAGPSQAHVGRRIWHVFKQAAQRVIHRFRPAGRRHPRDPLIPDEEYRAGRQPEER